MLNVQSLAPTDSLFATTGTIESCRAADGSCSAHFRRWRGQERTLSFVGRARTRVGPRIQFRNWWWQVAWRPSNPDSSVETHIVCPASPVPPRVKFRGSSTNSPPAEQPAFCQGQTSGYPRPTRPPCVRHSSENLECRLANAAHLRPWSIPTEICV